MRTSRSIATISYNTDSYLQHKLSELVEKGKIDFFCYITHLPEEDEKKEHKHLFIVPSCLIDTNLLCKEFEQITSLNDLPLKCMPFRNSKFADWYMYAIHDKDYLASKFMFKKYSYNIDDFFVSDSTYFTDLMHSSDFTKWKSQKLFKSMVASGMSFGAILERGVIPVNMVSQYKVLYNELSLEFERSPADRVVDLSTGEMVRDVFNG